MIALKARVSGRDFVPSKLSRTDHTSARADWCIVSRLAQAELLVCGYGVQGHTILQYLPLCYASYQASLARSRAPTCLLCSVHAARADCILRPASKDVFVSYISYVTTQSKTFMSQSQLRCEAIVRRMCLCAFASLYCSYTSSHASCIKYFD